MISNLTIERIKVQEFQQFQSPIEIGELTSGLNVFSGPNEAGKSTIARAVRMAFFQRYKSKSNDIRALISPWGDSGASPHVEIDFKFNNDMYSLHKTFLKKERCDLSINTQALDGDDAEILLAELLGYQISLHGRSKAENWGIPGLLWVEQGSGQEINAFVGNAKDQLRLALKGAMGDVLGSTGDAILKRVEQELSKLQTPSNSKPTGEYALSMKRVEDLSRKASELEQRISQYQSQVDRLADLEAQQDKESREKPWVELEHQCQAKELQRQQLRSLEQAIDEDQKRLNQHKENEELLINQLTQRVDKENDLANRRKALDEFKVELDEAVTERKRAEKQKYSALERLQRSQAEMQIAKDFAERQRLQQQILDFSTRLKELQQQLTTIENVTVGLQQLRDSHDAILLNEDDLIELRELQTQLRENELRREAVATRLSFNLLPHKDVNLGSEVISGTIDRLVTEPTDITIGGIGTVRVAPGGTDLQALSFERDQLRASIQGVLTRLGVENSDEAEAGLRKAKDLEREIKDYRIRLETLSPKGAEALREERDSLRARQQSAEQLLQRLPTASETELTLNEAETQLQEAQSEYDRSNDAVQLATGAEVKLRAEYESIQREVSRIDQELLDPKGRADYANAQKRSVEIRAEMDEITRTIRNQQTELAEARPDILEQDINRLSKSAELSKATFDNRKQEIARLQGELTTVGAEGLEEQNADIQLQLEREKRRKDELMQRAEALELLKEMLDKKRGELTRRLHAPLQKHLNNYLQLLFPGSSIEIHEDLTPGKLQRVNSAGEFDELSFGAREQMGLITRLAYADLLKEAGRPTLILLDDVLVNTDRKRLETMKRVITDAATRHQILMFTCHPENWMDMGVPVRSIDSLRAPI